MAEQDRSSSLLDTLKFLAALAVVALVSGIYGVAEATFYGSSQVVFITDSVSFVPVEQPLANGLFVAANMMVLIGGLTAGIVLVRISFSLGCFVLLAGAVMASLGTIALGLLALAPAGEFDLGQKIVFASIAVGFGGLGTAFMGSWLRHTVRNRGKREDPVPTITEDF